MAINKHQVAVLDGSTPGEFTDRSVVAMQLAIPNAAGTNVATVVTFAEPLPANYTVMVSPSQGLPWYVNNKTVFGFTVNLVGTVVAGTFDVVVFSL
jgi:hypothetical protein